MDIERPGFFITFEGVEGSGKSTQASLLYEYLLEGGYKVIATREPGATGIGRMAREALLDPKNKGMDPLAELFLFAAGRAQHVAEVIRPALASGKTVVCDRYIDSTTAYQAFGRGLDARTVQMVSDIASGGMMPDLTFLLDIPAALAMKRISGGSLDRIERETADFHDRVELGFHDCAERYPDRFRILDATLAPKEIFHQVIEAVEALPLI